MFKPVKTTLAGCALALPLLALSPETASAKVICLDTGVGQVYRLSNLPRNDKPKVFTGISYIYALPFVAAGYVNPVGDRIITFTENFDWDTGGYTDPIGIVHFRLPAGWPDSGTATWNLTYGGDGTAAGFSGTLSVISCP